MKIVITGAGGQLGSALTAELATFEVIPLQRSELDVTDRIAVEESLHLYQPNIVIHCGAMTNVDRCAEQPDVAFRVNGIGTQNIALACAKTSVELVYISTNEVFDGTSTDPYNEWVSPNPINPYGHSKAAGEWFVSHLCTRFYIVRTSWVYSHGGHNFPQRIQELAKKGHKLEVVTDEVGNPTYVQDLAGALANLIQTQAYGIYHLTNSGSCSRYEMAKEILRLRDKCGFLVKPILQEHYQRLSSPPRFTVLANHAAAALGISLRPWADALSGFLHEEAK